MKHAIYLGLYLGIVLALLEISYQLFYWMLSSQV